MSHIINLYVHGQCSSTNTTLIKSVHAPVKYVVTQCRAQGAVAVLQY